MATFFENLGWKVFRVPETATVLMSGGIAFGELNSEQVFDFQVSYLTARFVVVVVVRLHSSLCEIFLKFVLKQAKWNKM